MSLFVLCVIIGAGVAPPVFSWVEAAPGLGFRWIHWIQMSEYAGGSVVWKCALLTAVATAACLPFMIVILPETRTSIILRRRAEALRKERGMEDGGRYTARGEVEKKHFWASMRLSLSRPLSESDLDCASSRIPELVNTSSRARVNMHLSWMANQQCFYSSNR